MCVTGLFLRCSHKCSHLKTWSRAVPSASQTSPHGQTGDFSCWTSSCYEETLVLLHGTRPQAKAAGFQNSNPREWNVQKQPHHWWLSLLVRSTNLHILREKQLSAWVSFLSYFPSFDFSPLFLLTSKMVPVSTVWCWYRVPPKHQKTGHYVPSWREKRGNK